MISRYALAGLGLVLAATLTAPAATADQSAPERRESYRPTLEASKATVVAGSKVVLSGKVRPATEGGTVLLQKRIEGRKWAVEKKLTMNRRGAFRYTDRPTTAGTRSYRVVVPGAGPMRTGRSKPVEVTVLRWSRLISVEAREAQGTTWGGSVSIGGKRYADSVVSMRDVANGSMDWNLDPSCTSLRVRLGAGDDGDTDATALVTLTGDGQELFSRTFALTQSEWRVFDVSDVFRLAFVWSSNRPRIPVPQAGAVAAMATPEVLCAI